MLNPFLMSERRAPTHGLRPTRIADGDEKLSVMVSTRPRN